MTELKLSFCPSQKTFVPKVKYDSVCKSVTHKLSKHQHNPFPFLANGFNAKLALGVPTE